MSATRNRAGLLALLGMLCTSAIARAQAETAHPESAGIVSSNPAAQPGLPGSTNLEADSVKWNVGLDVTSVHSSNTGWATLATPTAGYRFNDILSVDAVLPIYFFRLAESRSAKPRPFAKLVNQRGELADLILSGRAEFTTESANYTLTGAVTAPTGDEAYGLTSGRVTFDISNEFDRTFGRFTPTLEIGAGDSSTLVNRLVTKTYTSLGPLGHFQIGLDTQFTSRLSMEFDAYEQLPIGDQKIYTSKTRKGKTTTVVTGHNVTEDNGFNAALDFTINRQTVFTSYYSRSLRLRTDTAGVGLTYYLRSTVSPENASLDDLIRQSRTH